MKLTYLNNLKYFFIKNLNEIYYFVIAEKGSGTPFRTAPAEKSTGTKT